uniref:Hexosyltransferase n=1 Tax=Phallusia mammillata TaxID=59560 RepID=A0A6F9D9V4_9ASCI|nr:chondroitin sulfate glucuronyltransferase-like [Phallusia mammillata]
MKLRRVICVNKIRPFLPVIIGISLGFSMSIVRMPISHEDCVHLSKDNVDRKLNSISRSKESMNDPNNPNAPFETMSKEEAFRYRKDRDFAPPVYDTLEDFEPRIITDPALLPKVDFQPGSNKKIVRPRFISTELGIREKLVSSIITSRNTFETLGVALNKTFSHHMKKVIYFDGLMKSHSNLPPSASGITLVLHPNANPVHILYQTLSYLNSKFGEEYDWFYITTDQSYSEGDRINEIVDHISINRRLYLGNPMQYEDEIAGTVTYCNMNSGFIISRLLLIDLVPGLDRCLEDMASVNTLTPDQWLGKCIKRITKAAVDCVSEEEGVVYHTFDLKNAASNFDPETENSDAFKNAVSVSGVETPEMMYLLHKRFSQIEIDRTYKEIVAIQEEIKELAPKLPKGEQELSWPIGINPPFKPSNRWDIIVWDYFTEDYTLTCPGEVPKCELTGVDKLDIQNILQTAIDRLNEKYNPKGLIVEKKKLINGYRRFDPQRGMEYILDLVLNVIVEKEKEEIEISHRVNLLRPLSQIEIIPMPYVTEAAKVNIILPLTRDERGHFENFMKFFAKVCLNNDENAALIIVFVYDPETAQQIQDNDIFAAQKELLKTYEARYKKDESNSKLIPWVSIKTEIPCQLKIMDVVAKKYSTDSLFMLTSVAANMNLNFLNRCRMNTIQGWQAFFPIPFSQYNPDIVLKNAPVPEQIDITPSNGHFDIYSFDEVCFYNSDYMGSKTKMVASMGDRNTDNTDAVETVDIYDMFVKYSQLHVFRAVEPQLTRRYIHRNCNSRNGDAIYQRCDRSNAEGLASRTQLAMELFPDDSKSKQT